MNHQCRRYLQALAMVYETQANIRLGQSAFHHLYAFITTFHPLLDNNIVNVLSMKNTFR